MKRVKFSPATILILVMPLLAACYTEIHGDDSSAVHSEIDEPPAAEYADAVERARPFVRALVVEENLPGLSLAVGIAGEIVWAEGFGWADIDERRPVTPQTLFRIGSVAKPMTATAVGLLHERGLLDLDAPVRNYVPSFPEKEWSVTTRQLMGHVAGVRHPPFDEELLFMRDHCESPLDGLELFADDPLLFTPGTRYRYSTYGWTLVGAVVEAAAGEPFLDFMQREVFDPLDMRDTALDDVRRRPLRPRDARRTLAAFRDAQHVANAARTRVRKINGVRPWLVCPVRPLWTGGDDSDSIRAQRNLGWGLHLVHDATRARNRRRGDHQCLLGRRPRPPSFLGREATLALATSRRNLTSRPFLLSFVQRLIEPRSRYHRCRSSGRPAHRPPPLGRAVSGAHDHPFLAW